jgi:CO/xanthine dehydrogenase FAD-binding subunit
MRAFLPDYEAASVSSLDEALRLLALPPDPVRGRYVPLAGGTDLMVLLAMGKLPAGRYLDIWSVPELRGITVHGDRIELGALTTYSEVRSHPVLGAEFPMLAQAAAESGAHAIQNRGTLGGNIANASPAADSPPALLAYDAELELVASAGSRRIPYSEFHTGYKQMRLGPGELIAKVHLRRRPEAARTDEIHFYRKVGTRRAQAISKVCLAAYGRRQGGALVELRLALGSVAPVPLRCPATERALLDLGGGPGRWEDKVRAAQAALAAEIRPIDDVRSSAEYRMGVAQRLIRQFAALCAPGQLAALCAPGQLAALCAPGSVTPGVSA